MAERMANPIRVLLLEDAEDEALLLVRELRRGGLAVEYTRVQTESDFREAVAREHWDLILADYSLPRLTGLMALQIVRSAGSDVPFIFASGTVHEDVASAGMALGANDYVLKGDLTRLVPAVERELQESAARESRRIAEEALQRSESQFRSLFEHAAIGISLEDPETHRVLRVNSAFQEMVGYTEEELRQRTFVEITVPEDVQREKPLYAELVSGARDSYTMEKRYIHRNGHSVWTLITVSVVRDADGQALFDTAIVQDIREQKRNTEALQASEERYRAVFTGAPIGIAIGDTSGQIVNANEQFATILGYSVEELQGQNFVDLTYPDDVEADVSQFRHLLAGEIEQYSMDKRYVRKDGQLVLARLNVTALRDLNGQPVFDVAMIQDVTEQVRAQEALRESEERHRQMFEGNQAIKLLIDPETQSIVDANSAAADFYGYSRDQLRQMHISQINILSETQLVSQLAAATQGVRSTLQFQHRLATGEIREVEVFSSPINSSGRLLLYSIITDITERKQYEEQLRHHAFHDALTGLPNRALFFDRMTQAIRGAGRAGAGVAVLLLNIDRFKDVNDGLGHDVGDALLQELGIRLTKTLRDSDTVARLGGDEFGLLLPETDALGASHAANKLIAVLAEPCDLSGQVVYPSASLGASLYPMHGDDPSILLRRANVAMYGAKRNGTGFAIYEQESDPQSTRKLRLTSDLRGAISQDQLTLHYQPKVNLQAKTANRVEALVRWIHPELGTIPPDQFIGLAEHSGLIKPLTLWVLNEATRQLSQWTKDGMDIHVAVNLSAWNLQDPELSAQVEATLSRWNVAANKLMLEITEGAIMLDPERAMHTVSCLHDLGVRIAIDDFGTGYSSLAYLLRLPTDEIKIDRSFVMSMRTKNDESSIIVRSVVDLGQNLKRLTVAEGVETQEQLDILTGLGCDYGQGYFLSRPVPAHEYAQWLQKWNASTRLAS